MKQTWLLLLDAEIHLLELEQGKISTLSVNTNKLINSLMLKFHSSCKACTSSDAFMKLHKVLFQIRCMKKIDQLCIAQIHFFNGFGKSNK